LEETVTTLHQTQQQAHMDPSLTSNTSLVNAVASICLETHAPLLLSWFKHFAALTAGKFDSSQYGGSNQIIDTYAFDDQDLAASGEQLSQK
jgi:hypothetical protein